MSAGSYNHGALTRKEAERRLRAVDYDCFLYRESESFPGCLTLSVKRKGKLNHVLMEWTGVRFVPKGASQPFQDMTTFVNRVSSYLPPCPKPSDDKTTSDAGERWFPIQFFNGSLNFYRSSVC